MESPAQGRRQHFLKRGSSRRKTGNMKLFRVIVSSKEEYEVMCRTAPMFRSPFGRKSILESELCFLRFFVPFRTRAQVPSIARVVGYRQID